MEITRIVQQQIDNLQNLLNQQEISKGEILFNKGVCQILSQSARVVELILDDEEDGTFEEYKLAIEEDENIVPFAGKEPCGWNQYAYACLLQFNHEINTLGTHKVPYEYKKYTRKGMIRRVLKERMLKAEKAEYRVEWAKNIYGNHIVTNEAGVKYIVFLRDFENETGYSDSQDAKYNKLGTTKHIMYVFRKLEENQSLFRRLDKTFPFLEVYCDPLNEGLITWCYPCEIPQEEKLLISKYFGKSNFIHPENIADFLGFIEESCESDLILIRPEVRQKLEHFFEKRMLGQLAISKKPDFGLLKTKLFDYQKEGVMFSLFKKAAIIADEMGLGKTMQAIATAVLKKQIFGFSKTLVVCPASIKEQWKREVEKFCHEKALVVLGTPDERAVQYQSSEYLFFIVNYETILRDRIAINNAGIDFLILDEAQRAKNHETKTAASLKLLEAKHKLAITGTPIENKLIDIYSIMGILDAEFLSPLWEFSYQYCLFDPDRPNKINGYYNLKSLNEKLESVLIRREKRKVIRELPNIQQKDIVLELSPLQGDYHASYAKGLAQIIRKKFLTPYDVKRIQLLLANMRMTCDSTYLIDDQTNESPKLEELQHILLNQLDIKNQNRKVIIFSEWVKVHKLIGQLLRKHGIGFVELNGKIPVKSRGLLIKKFEEDPNYKVFLSTEAGGTGLNLQFADTLINFELPWNPAKKNQRIGRIDRLGQKSTQLTIINLIMMDSIEQQISSGLLVKQSLFDGVLSDERKMDYVDFTSKGRSQFIQQLEDFVESAKEPEQQQFATNREETPELWEEQPDTKDEELDFSGEEPNQINTTSHECQTNSNTGNDAEKLEEVMNHGMQFLAGMFKMSTGKELDLANQSIEVDKESGEVTMKFKLPG